MHTKSHWIKFFPFASPRKEQEDAINFALDEFIDKNVKYVCMDLGTGLGKSAIAVTIARYLGSKSYVLTTQKVLQDQYVHDFGQQSNKLLCSIKSSSNYSCNFYPDQSCGDSRRMLSTLGEELKETDFYKCCKFGCKYTNEKQKFIGGNLGVTNFSYFLAETSYAGMLEPRSLLVVDESHNIEKSVGAHTEIVFSENFAKNTLKIKVPKLKTQATVCAWVKTTYLPALKSHITSLQKQLLSDFHRGNKEEELKKLSKQFTSLDKHICKVNRFFLKYVEDNWVVNFSVSPKTKSRKFEFKPVDVSEYVKDSLFAYGEKVLMLSATIINKDAFCRSVGLNPNIVSYLSIPSPFSKENRQVHYISAGSMSYRNIDTTLPVMAKTIEMLLAQHKDEKGLIHAVSYKVATFIKDNIKSKRLLLHDSENREQVLEYHKLNSEPTVLISPSMSEGIDLSDDASRFQIMCKVPFPPLGDELVKKRMKKDATWYPYQTVKTVIQSLGRSIRNEDDYAISYILDDDWEYFLKRNKSLFSIDFLSTLK